MLVKGKKNKKMKWMLHLCFFLCFVAVFSRSEDVLEAMKARERVLSFLENDAVVSGSPSKPLMVPLTLIQGADSKGAGDFPFSVSNYTYKLSIIGHS